MDQRGEELDHRARGGKMTRASPHDMRDAFDQRRIPGSDQFAPRVWDLCGSASRGIKIRSITWRCHRRRDGVTQAPSFKATLMPNSNGTWLARESVTKPPWTAAVLLPPCRGQPCGPQRCPLSSPADRASFPGRRVARPESGSRAAAVQGTDRCERGGVNPVRSATKYDSMPSSLKNTPKPLC